MDGIMAKIGVISAIEMIWGVLLSVNFGRDDKSGASQIRLPNNAVINFQSVALNIVLNSIQPEADNSFVNMESAVAYIKEANETLRRNEVVDGKMLREISREVLLGYKCVFQYTNNVADKLCTLSLRVWMDKLGVKRHNVNVDSDGNCFFHSALSQLNSGRGAKGFVSGCYDKEGMKIVVDGVATARQKFAEFVKRTYTPDITVAPSKIQTGHYNELVEYGNNMRWVDPMYVYAFADFWQRPVISIRDTYDGRICLCVGLPGTTATPFCTVYDTGITNNDCALDNFIWLMPVLQRLQIEGRIKPHWGKLLEDVQKSFNTGELLRIFAALVKVPVKSREDLLLDRRFRESFGDEVFYNLRNELGDHLVDRLDDFHRRNNVDPLILLEFVCADLRTSGNDILLQCIASWMCDPNTVVVYMPVIIDRIGAGSGSSPMNHFHALIHDDITPDEIKRENPL
jgi:hypothetical protein